MKIVRNQNGIGLVEVIFSLGIAVVILTSLVSLSVFTMRTSVQNKLLIKASSFATQQIELVRAYRDLNGWATFFSSSSGCTVNCYIDPTSMTVVTGVYTQAVTPSDTVRIFFISGECDGYTGDDQNDCRRISVQARWQVGDQTKYVHNYTELANWGE